MKKPELKLKEGISVIEGSNYAGLNNDIILEINDSDYSPTRSDNFTYILSFYNFSKDNITENINYTIVSDNVEKESQPYNIFFKNASEEDNINDILASSIFTFIFEAGIVSNKYKVEGSRMEIFPKKRFKLIIDGVSLDSSETINFKYNPGSAEIPLNVERTEKSISLTFSSQPVDFKKDIKFGDIILYSSVIDSFDGENINSVFKKTYIDGVDDKVSFNLRGVLGNVNNIQPFKASFTFIDTLNPSLADLKELNIIPNNVNISENVNYDLYVCNKTNKVKFLLNSPSGSLYYPLNSIFSVSVISPAGLLQGSVDAKLKIVYYSVSNPTSEYSSQVYSFSSIFKKQEDSIVYSDFKDGRWDLFIKTSDTPLISKMSVQIFSGDNIELTEKYYINLYQKCNNPYGVLFFLNDLGGISSFDRVESVTETDKLEENIYTNATKLGVKNPFLATSRHTLEITSELLNKDEWSLAKEMLHSGYVFKLNDEVFQSSSENNLRDNVKYIILSNSNLSFNSDDINTQLKFSINE